jgi:hypothetical protein
MVATRKESLSRSIPTVERVSFAYCHVRRPSPQPISNTRFPAKSAKLCRYLVSCRSGSFWMVTCGLDIVAAVEWTKSVSRPATYSTTKLNAQYLRAPNFSLFHFKQGLICIFQFKFLKIWLYTRLRRQSQKLAHICPCHIRNRFDFLLHPQL